MTPDPDPRVKVVFRFQRDAKGWPPVDAEGLWADDLGNDRYRLDNTPFFARGVAWKDVVVGRRDGDQILFHEVHQHSGHSTIRIHCQDVAKRTAVTDELDRRGCSSEGIPIYNLVAIDVPPTVDLKAIREYLEAGAKRGEWAYEEGLLAGPSRNQ